MKKTFLTFSFLCCGFIYLHAQSAGAPRLAPYSNDSASSAQQHTPAVKCVLAPSARDSSVSTVTSTAIPELLYGKKEDPVITPQ
jgi:hypothetical protein